MLTYPGACSANIITSETVAVEKATGKAYVHSSADVNGRPVIVIRVEKHISSAHTTLDTSPPSFPTVTHVAESAPLCGMTPGWGVIML